MKAVDRIKPSVRGLEPYVVKGKTASPHYVKLNQNENPYDVPDEVKEEILREMRSGAWNRYPEVLPRELLHALAAHTGHPEEGILAGNGSNELMYTILMACVTKGTPVVIPEPSFFLYEKAVTVFDGKVVAVKMRADLSFDTGGIIEAAKKNEAALVVLVSPNSPTGQSMSREDVERVLSGTDALVLVDEAYVEFSDWGTVQPLLGRHDRLIVLRTFSKAFSLAGLRIGYLLAHPDLCAEITKPKIPFAVDRFASAAAIALMERKDLVDSRIACIVNEKRRMTQAMKEIPGVTVYPSDTNFVVFRTPLPAPSAFQRLLDADVLVRDVSAYPMMEGMLRVNAGTELETDRFLSALRTILQDS